MIQNQQGFIEAASDKMLEEVAAKILGTKHRGGHRQ